MFPIPHGVACARLLAPVAEANVKALRQRRGKAATILRYEEVARILADEPPADVSDGVAALRALVEELMVPRLGAYGVRETDVPSVVAQAMRASSMQGNPVELTEEELGDVLRGAL
jgi:alcohol dehydrogenase class IV